MGGKSALGLTRYTTKLDRLPFVSLRPQLSYDESCMTDGRGSPPERPDGSDHDAHAETLERFRNPLRLFAARRTGDWTAAEDIAQEAICRTLEALRNGKVRNAAALPGFVFQTALHVCMHHGSAAGRENRALTRFSASPGPSAVDPLSDLISEERREQVRAALERLDEEDRAVLSLTYVEAASTSEIGRRLNLTEGNVRVRRHRALKRLGEILGVTRQVKRGLKE